MRGIVARLLAIPEATVATQLARLEREFRPIHANIDDVFRENYAAVKNYITDRAITEVRQRFIGACFTMEYAIESAALFNPSMVPAIDQSNVPPGAVRFLMSLRATGEGHLSSIVFRRGLVHADGSVTVDPPGRYSRPLRATIPATFEKADFVNELRTLRVWTEQMQTILNRLGHQFTRVELSDAIDQFRTQNDISSELEESCDALLALTQANYRIPLAQGADISEMVIFPFSDNERRGIEDLRLVRFTADDGSVRYYGTYTAYNGFQIFPHLLEYPVGDTVGVHMLTGRCARNKGMALFPRTIHGRYAMIARLDNENLYYMESDDVRVWDEAHLFRGPEFPWEVIQIGNCGSPLETEAGWLLLTHGVGPMRQYCIGAILLDLGNPCQVIGQTTEPILVPTGRERFGYVPNVVYSCGAMIHAGKLILPYAMSDVASSIAVIDLAELLHAMAPQETMMSVVS